MHFDWWLSYGIQITEKDNGSNCEPTIHQVAICVSAGKYYGLVQNTDNNLKTANIWLERGLTLVTEGSLNCTAGMCGFDNTHKNAEMRHLHPNVWKFGTTVLRMKQIKVELNFITTVLRMKQIKVELNFIFCTGCYLFRVTADGLYQTARAIFNKLTKDPASVDRTSNLISCMDLVCKCAKYADIVDPTRREKVPSLVPSCAMCLLPG